MNALLPFSDLTQQLMQRTLQQKTIALPFAKDIFLLETHVAGLRHYSIESLSSPLQLADKLQLRREPNNSHDALAIEILTSTHHKLGYVPRHRNPILARLMDAGKALVAEVATLQHDDDNMPTYAQNHTSGASIIDVRLKIFLHE